jgi:hypothetical protein
LVAASNPFTMSKFVQRRKSWADRQCIPTGYWGEVIGGIHIREENRATVWEFRREGIEELQRIMISQYKSKGVRCTLFGIDDGKNIKYAVFLQSGFLKKVDDDE